MSPLSSQLFVTTLLPPYHHQAHFFFLLTCGNVYMFKDKLVCGGFAPWRRDGGAAGRRFLLSPLEGGGRLLLHAN